jgi:hypothetical protein
MTNFKEESHDQNEQNDSEHINSAPDPQKPIPDPTSQGKASGKIEITITRKQLLAATWLFKQADKQKPGWLRQKFYINQRRRKYLNYELWEAQLDKEYCGHGQDNDGFFSPLHELWHQINGVPSCK